METISDLARRWRLPRRTVQYWYDNEVVSPAEVELAGMLVPFAKMNATIGLIKLLAKVFRETIFEHERQTEDEANYFGPIVKAARAGKPAVLAVQVVPKPGADVPFTFRFLAGPRLRDISGGIQEAIDQASSLPFIIINLTEALKRRDGDASE